MYSFFKSPFYDFEFLRLLGTAPTQGCDVAECLVAADQIKLNDPESWYTVWSGLAEKTEAIAHEARNNGDSEAERWAFLRASNYRRTSEFMLRENFEDPRLLDAITKSVANFEEACKLLDSQVVRLLVPYEGSLLPANLFLPKTGTVLNGMAPVIVNTGGFDSTQEEIFHFTAAGARLRGYATLTFEGPGQGVVLRRDKLFFRPDWEAVIASVLDELFRQAQDHKEWNLDLHSIAIIGNSMGGYFALRGATDPRIKACICSDGVFDMGALGRERSPFFMKYLSDSAADTLLDFALRFDFTTRWEVRHGMFALGQSSMTKALRKIAEFTCEPPGRKVLSEITCPVLVTHAQDTNYSLGTTQIYESLTALKEGEKSLWNPESPGSGSLQAKVAALSHLHMTVCGWLDQVFTIQRSSK